MSYAIKVVGFANGGPCPIAGQWIESYDLDVHAPGRPYPTGDCQTTSDPEKALAFDDIEKAWEVWRAQSTAVPLRPDGKPNRPLTGFTVMIEPLP